ncbi:helix-turn-helix domain-containing protein [Aerococcaceae bacterium DSM 111022]|nr:helix-turn-helix domain-containing protein [Aerococcaceae bacterium DSM 111022]
MPKPTIDQYEKDTISLPTNQNYLVRHSTRDPKLYALHYHDHYELILQLSGKILYTVAGEHYWLTPGTILVIPPYQLHQPIEQGDHKAERYILRFSKEYLTPFTQKSKTFTKDFEQKFTQNKRLIQLTIKQNQQITKVFDALKEEEQNNYFGTKHAQQAYMIQLILLLYRLEDTTTNTEKINADQTIIQDAVNFIDTNYQENLTIAKLAKRYYVDRYYFSKTFTQLIGTPPSTYILKRRLLEAQRLLSNGTPAQKTAHQCGFNDYSNFYRQFHTAYGQSPTQYRKSR